MLTSTMAPWSQPMKRPSQDTSRVEELDTLVEGGRPIGWQVLDTLASTGGQVAGEPSNMARRGGGSLRGMLSLGRGKEGWCGSGLSTGGEARWESQLVMEC